MIVRLKESGKREKRPYYVRFNSMIVRLKDVKDSLAIAKAVSFNSMIVRLKAPNQRKEMKRGKFQFYDSPIKSTPTVHPCGRRLVSIL